MASTTVFLKLNKIVLIIERGKGREREWERNIDMREKHRLAAFCMYPNQGPDLQPRHVP